MDRDADDSRGSIRTFQPFKACSTYDHRTSLIQRSECRTEGLVHGPTSVEIGMVDTQNPINIIPIIGQNETTCVATVNQLISAANRMDWMDTMNVSADHLVLSARASLSKWCICN